MQLPAGGWGHTLGYELRGVSSVCEQGPRRDEDRAMTSISDIQESIRSLPADNYAELRAWMSELDWNRWDDQIEADSTSGSLDFLIDEAVSSKQQGSPSAP